MAQGICSFALLTDSSSLLLGAWKDFPNSPFLPACKNLILSTESLSALYIVISWVFRTFRGIMTFVWGFSPSQSLLRVGSFMPYPGLFVQFVFFFFINVFCSSCWVLIVLCFFVLNFLPNSLEPLGHNRNNRLEISGQTPLPYGTLFIS